MNFFIISFVVLSSIGLSVVECSDRIERNRISTDGVKIVAGTSTLKPSTRTTQKPSKKTVVTGQPTSIPISEPISEPTIEPTFEPVVRSPSISPTAKGAKVTNVPTAVPVAASSTSQTVTDYGGLAAGMTFLGLLLCIGACYFAYIYDKDGTFTRLTDDEESKNNNNSDGYSGAGIELPKTQPPPVPPRGR